jgi:tetratricopeptide (TPR) repeat protein
VAIPHLRSLAMFGLAAACAVAGAGAWGLLHSPRSSAKSAETHHEEDGKTLAANEPADLPVSPGHDEVAAPTSGRIPDEANRGSASGHEEPEPSRSAADRVTPQAVPTEGRPRPMPMTGAKLTEKTEKKRSAEILRADDEFREGKIASAMKLYGAAIEAHPSVLDPVVQFRWALCAESLGLLDEAAERYQMLADATSSQSWKGFARWGLSRVLFEQQKTELAHRIAADLWLNQDGEARLWRSELLHWHAHLLYRRAAGDSSARLLEDDALAGCRIIVRPAELLEIAGRIHASETAAPFDPPPAAHQPATSGKDPEAMYAQYRTGGASVYEAISQFCEAAHWSVHWSSAAEQLARSHRVRASVARGSIACLLDTLCDGPRLMWVWENQALRVFEVGERSAAETRQYQLKSAGRSAREALELYRDVRWSAYSRLAIAHIETLDGSYISSRKSLEDLIANSPKGDLLAEAWFDLGKVHLHEDAIEKATAAFQQAIDHSMGSGLEPIADLYLGRLLIEANEPRRAVVPLRRSLALSATRDRGTAALTLGAAYLLAEQPQNTAEILRSNQNWLDVEATRDAAAFLSCLAQVQGGHDPTRLKYDMRSLMTAISHVRSGQFFGRSGAVLIAMAYRELGLNGEAADICRDAIAHMPPCALRMKLELMLVDELIDRREFEATEAQLRAITEASNLEVRQMAYERLCDLLLERGRRDDAEMQSVAWLKICGSADSQAKALRSLGRCLQLKGDYLNAALCFSGTMPHGTEIQSPVTTTTKGPQENGLRLP